MVDKISRDQYHDLCQSKIWDDTESFNRMLEEITGITARPYVGYMYYDDSGNYIGDNTNNDIRDLLSNAFIEIEDMMVY